MKRIYYFKFGWILLLAVLVLGVSIITPAAASNKVVKQTPLIAHQSAATSINATFYLTTASLKSLFQSHMDSQVPTSVNSAITSMISTLPKQDQDWAYLMATTLIQPSATLVSLVPQKGGLAMTLKLSLYPGDPLPTTSSMLITFTVLNSTTAQVSASPMNGSPALMSGPLSTFTMPLGSLNKINSTPGCGASSLALNLKFPVSVGQSQSSSPPQQSANATGGQNLLASQLTTRTLASSNVNSYIEIPASSLASMGSAIGSMPVGNGLTAQNFQISVQNPNILITSDIIWSGLNIGTATTTMMPSAEAGKMVVHVVNTTLNLFGFIPFPMNSYNAQTEQTLNSELGSAFGSTYYVASAAIGPNSQLPCAAQDSLVLSGTANLNL
ncbi:MAG TPA: hypothetical protein VFA09_00775 [Ktedonobacteraceae bacterium]|nr:hypothetical protein [Ktedonobacteraceae bacterium]